MRAIATEARRHERGSALIIAVLVTVILTLLGVSYLLMAETENRIAENERLSAQALFVGEAAVRQVKRWFDRPQNAGNVINPPLAVIDRTLRMIDDDGDPGTSPIDADGTSGKEYYKQGIDRNSDSLDDVFHKPYRASFTDTLLGTEDGPDMRIDENFSPAAKTFLETLTERLLSGYPDWGGGLLARISRIDVYAPPYVDVGGTWTRYGMGTVKVHARIYQTFSDGTEQVLAERMIKAVLNETPFPGPFGPIHSCDSLAWNGDFEVHWGVGTAVGTTDLTNNHGKIWASLPRDPNPPSQKVDLLWGTNAQFTAYANELYATNEEIEDPWFRFLSGGALSDAPNGNQQPWAFNWDEVPPLDDGEWPNHGNNPDDGDHSNVFQNMPLVTCPEFDYETWKGIATSGGSDVHYYVWTSGTSFKENGFGTAATFRDITDQAEGLFFFDTADGIEPYDNDSNGEYDNLTPEIKIQGGTWGTRGFIYLNAYSFATKGVAGRAATFNAPPEPYHDANANGRYDAGEAWINMRYPTTLADPFMADDTDTMLDDGTFGATPVYNSKGPDINATATLWGILYTNGYWDSTGNARYYGSVISKQGISEVSPTAGTPDVYWDNSILTNWPPDNWDLPRVIITRWESEL